MAASVVTTHSVTITDESGESLTLEPREVDPGDTEAWQMVGTHIVCASPEALREFCRQTLAVLGDD